MLALFDVVVTILLPLLTGAVITYERSGGSLLRHPPEQPGLSPGAFRPVRALCLGLPLVWQAAVGTYLLVERVFGVLFILGIGMAFGMVVRAIVGKVQQHRSF
ncbi:hypothetical protein [Streptomyces sp. NBC_01304]|uniref:hypothetical protein n=1 Tax=Streptomyces sp. NBC_01304 TaxID=2903818 RepID=UPI002E127700|nr:hypothetical protein OG430_47760 [Streptomyces sp. NBC_01304]